jgi:hypothetical protein
MPNSWDINFIEVLRELTKLLKDENKRRQYEFEQKYGRYAGK